MCSLCGGGAVCSSGRTRQLRCTAGILTGKQGGGHGARVRACRQGALCLESELWHCGRATILTPICHGYTRAALLQSWACGRGSPLREGGSAIVPRRSWCAGGTSLVGAPLEERVCEDVPSAPSFCTPPLRGGVGGDVCVLWRARCAGGAPLAGGCPGGAEAEGTGPRMGLLLPKTRPRCAARNRASALGLLPTAV